MADKNSGMEISETSVGNLFGEEWLEIAERAGGSIIKGAVENGPVRPRLKPINRQQMMMRSIDIEKLVEADHAVRAIWEMLGQVDLSRFEQGFRAVEGHAGAGDTGSAVAGESMDIGVLGRGEFRRASKLFRRATKLF
jgi:hypothetical protein